MEHAIGALDIGTSGCRGGYLIRKTASVRNIVPISFPGGPNILEPNEPAEMAIKKIGEGDFIRLFGWEARSITASHNTIKFPNLKALLDNSVANKPARYIIFTNLKALANLGLEMTEDDLLRDSYTHFRKVFREWCDSKDYPQPEEFVFAAPVVKNSCLDANEGGVSFDKGRMERLLREAGFTNARVSTTEAEARLMSILSNAWWEERDLEGEIALVDAGAGTVQVVSIKIDRERMEKGADLEEIDPPACIGLGGETIYRAVSKWITSNFGELTSWNLETAKIRFDQMFRQYTVNHPSWEVELVDDPKIVLTGDIMDKEICPLAYGDICKFLEEQMETFKKCGLIIIDGGLGNCDYFKSRSKGWPVANKVRFTPSTSRTAIPEGLILLAADYFTVTLRKVTSSFGIAVELERGWPDVLRGRKKPTKAELALWGGDIEKPDLVVQYIKKKGEEIAVSVGKAKPFPLRRLVCKTDAVLEIAFAMAKAETSNVVGKHILLPFLPLKECEMLRALELDLNESFHLPEKPRMLHYAIRLFREDFRTKFDIVPISTWAIKARKEKKTMHFYEDCFEEMIVVKKENDDAAEKLTDAPKLLLAEEFSHMPRKNGPTKSFFRGSSVFDEDDPASNSDKPASSNDKPISSNDKPASSNNSPASSNDKSAPNTPDTARTQQRPSSHSTSPLSPPEERKRRRDDIGEPEPQRPKRHKGAAGSDLKQTSASETPDVVGTQLPLSRPDPALESVESEEAEQSKYITYPMDGVLSGNICAEVFKILRSDDAEVNAPIVDAKLGALKINHEDSGVGILDTSLWEALVASKGQKRNLARISLPDEFFDLDFAVIPIFTRITDGVYWSVAIFDGPGRLLQKGIARAERFIHVFRPVTPDSGDGATPEEISELLKFFLSVVAHEQKNTKFHKVTIESVPLSVPAETHSRSSGLQVVEVVGNFLKSPREFLDNENTRLTLQPAEIKKQTEAIFMTTCENLFKLLVPEDNVHPDVVAWQLEPLSTEYTLFVPPKFYAALCGNGKSEDTESAKRQIKNVESFKKSKFIGIPVLEEGGRWQFFVIREPSRLKTGKNGIPKDLIIGVDSKDFDFAHVYCRLLKFLTKIFDIPFPRWAYGGKKCEKYGSELGLPWPEEAIKTGYQLVRKAKELARDAEGLLGGAVDNERIVDNIEPKVIMAGWMRDIEQITGTNMKSINGPCGTVAGSSINHLPQDVIQASSFARSVPSLSAHNGATTRKRAAAVVDTGPLERNKLPDNAPRPSEADVQLQLDYMENSFPTDEDSKLFKEYHIEKIKERKSVIVSVSPGESNGEFDDCVREFMPPKSATQSASVDLSRCLSCRYYDDQKLGFCDSRDSLCTQSKGKDRPTIFEHVETLSPQDAKLVQGGVTWFVVPVHDSNKPWRHALAELKRQVEALKSGEEEDDEEESDEEKGDEEEGDEGADENGGDDD